jgi:pectate lyase
MSTNLFSAIDGTTSNNSSCGCTPPDTTGAAGPTVVIEDVNSALAIFNKATGAFMSRQSLLSFYSPLGSVQSLSDPQIFYDDLAGRFVVADLDYNTSSLSRLDVAFSNDSNPADGYQFRRYDMNDHIGASFDFADYPKGGYNADAYVFSFNMFPNLGSFNHVDTLAIDKTNFDNSFRVNAGLSHFTLEPAKMHGSNPGDPMWMTETGTSTSMHVVKMTNVLSATPGFTTTNITVPAYSSEPGPLQPGGTRIVTFDTRLLNAAFRNGLLVTGHTIGSGGLSQARWYEFDTTTPSPTLVQSGNVFRGSGVYTQFPTLDINANNDIGMTFMESSLNEFLSMYVTGQLAGDAGSGVVQIPAEAFAGTGVYSSSRIGDYSGTSVDPSDDLSFWSFNEYKGGASWNTGVAGFQMAQPVALPFSDDFEAGAGNWTPSSNPGSYSVITDGSQVYQVNNNGTPVSRSSAGDSSWTDYTYQADVKVTRLSAGGSVMLMARFLDNNNFYGFLYDQATGTGQIVKMFQGVQTVLASSGPVSLHLNQDYTAVVTVSGSSLSVSVNGRPIVSATDSSIASGKVGFAASNATAELDNVLVSPPANIASGAWTAGQPLGVPADGTPGGALLNMGVLSVSIPALPLNGPLGAQTGTVATTAAAPLGANQGRTIGALLGGARRTDGAAGLTALSDDVFASAS